MHDFKFFLTKVINISYSSEDAEASKILQNAVNDIENSMTSEEFNTFLLAEFDLDLDQMDE